MKKTSLADSGQGKMCSSNLGDLSFYFMLPFRNGSYFVPLVVQVYFAEFNFPVPSYPKRVIFTMFSLNKYCS